MLIAETKRLKIRLMTEADVPVVSTIWTDAEVTRFMGGPRVFEKLCSGFSRS